MTGWKMEKKFRTLGSFGTLLSTKSGMKLLPIANGRLELEERIYQP